MSSLDWYYSDEGVWEALSIFHDDGCYFTWVININEDGLFSIKNSSSELLPKDHKFRNVDFTTFKDAKLVCEVIESNYRKDNIQKGTGQVLETVLDYRPSYELKTPEENND